MPAAPVDAVTLLALRMLYSAPFFLAMAWWSGRAPRRADRSRAPTGVRSPRSASSATTCRACSTSSASQYISASLERLVLFLYPTIVVVLSALLLAQPITRRAGGGAAAVVRRHRAGVLARPARRRRPRGATRSAAALVFASAVAATRCYLVGAGRRHRAPRQRALHRVGDARLDACSCSSQFALTRPLAALAAPASAQRLVARDGDRLAPCCRPG